MKRYRIKLSNKRVIGPLNSDEINELFSKGKVNGSELFQEFPLGEWTKLENIKELSKLYEEDKTTVREETHLVNIRDIDLTKKEEPSDKEEPQEPSEPLKEFQFEHKDPFENKAVYTETDLKSKIEASKEDKIEKQEDNKKEPEEVSRQERSFSLDDGLSRIDVNDSTRIRTINKPLKDFEEDKTQINPEYQKYLKELAEEQKRIEEEEKRKAEEIVIEEVSVDYENEATEMINLTDVRKDLLNAVEIEQEFNKKEEERAKEIRKKKKLKKKRLDEESEEDDEDEEGDNSLRKKIVVAAIVFLTIWLGFFDEPEVKKGELKPIKLTAPFIKFPARFDVPDENLAKDFYNKGLKENRKYTYKALNDSVKLYFSSAENKFNDNKAMAKLIFLYSHNLINSDRPKDHANTIFKLVQIFQNKTFTDPNFASAIAYFYYSIEKYEASIKTFDKYITLNKKVATAELFAVKLRALLKAGYIDKAKNIAKKLETVKNRDLFVIQSLVEYYKIQQENEKIDKILKEAENIYPNNAYILIERGFQYIEFEDLKNLKKTIFKLNNLNVEGSKYYYSRYLILKGMYHAFKKNIKQATKDFKKSLELFESVDLINKLALLSEATDDETNNLIINSKARKAIIRGRNHLKENDLQRAFKEALIASDIAPDYIEAQLFLAELQMKRGYIKDAIVQLEDLYKQNGSSLDILFTLIDAYTEAYKFKKVSTLLNTAQSIAGDQDYKFFSAKAKYSRFKGEINSASGWLIRAINANPLDDTNVYELAKLYIKYHKYDKGKTTLKKAMALDPANVEYRLSFAEILYELETSNAAIGYLYNVLKDFPDNPKILSAIGIYFYRSGQIKKYEQIKKTLLNIPEKDISLFNFLIESSKLDDDIEKVIKYSEELISLEPGNLKVRMELATIFIDLQRYKKAKKQIDAISERLDSYPRLQYLNAKLYFLVDDIEKSKSLAMKEIKENPTVIDGYLLLADIYIKEKDLLKAKKEYMKAIQLQPRSVDAIMGVAYVAFHSDQYDMALDQYQKAIEIDPNRAESYKLLGDAYRKLGQSQYAIKNYKHFLELSPNSKYKKSIETYIRTMQ